jgi:hypothetical protein
MRTSYPEEEVRLNQENEQINKIYELLRSGYSLREILNTSVTEQGSQDLTEPTGQSEANSSLSAKQGHTDYHYAPSDFVKDIDRTAAGDIPSANVGETTSSWWLGYKRVAVLSVMGLIAVIAGVTFFMRLNSAESATDLVTAANRADARASSDSFDVSAAIVKLPFTDIGASAQQPMPVSPGDVPDPGAQTGATSVAAPKPLLTDMAASVQQPMHASANDDRDVAAQSATVRLPPEEVARLISRGDAMLAAGDAGSARLFYGRAVDAGEASAALRLGETYDTAFLVRAGLTGVRGNILQAKYWYRRAAELGVTEAEFLLKNVETK